MGGVGGQSSLQPTVVFGLAGSSPGRSSSHNTAVDQLNGSISSVPRPPALLPTPSITPHVKSNGERDGSSPSFSETSPSLVSPWHDASGAGAVTAAVLDFRGIGNVDATACRMLIDLNVELAEHSVIMLISGCDRKLLNVLDRSGVVQAIGESLVFAGLPEAVGYALNARRGGEQSEPTSPPPTSRRSSEVIEGGQLDLTDPGKHDTPPRATPPRRMASPPAVASPLWPQNGGMGAKDLV